MNEIWIISEECHGDVSYWTDEMAAYDEARRLITNSWTEDYPIILDEISNDDIDNSDYGVHVRKHELNKSWLS